MCIKSEFKEICLKLATNGKSGKGFLLISKVCPQGFSALAPGLYTCIKSLKMCIKSDFEEIILKLEHMGKEKRPFCCHKIFVPSGLSAFSWGYIRGMSQKFVDWWLYLGKRRGIIMKISMHLY